MSGVRGELYGGQYRSVLEHPDHRDGVNHGTMTITAVTQLASTVARITATLEHEGDPIRWQATNPAIRLELPGDDGVPVSRVYTVREHRVSGENLEIDFDVVKHGTRSIVMRWLEGLSIGDSVRILGPRPHFTPAYAEGAPVLMFADETAIPALATILRDWPEGYSGHAWIETPDAEVCADLPECPGVQVTWLRRVAQEEPGSTGRLIEAALAASEQYSGECSVWACGEHGEMRTIRDHFRRKREMTREQVVVFGYWRRARTSTQIDEERLQRYERELAKDPRMTILDEFEDGE